jgi:hypothetical protein
MDEIIKYLDNYLDSTRQFEITAVQANAVLHKASTGYGTLAGVAEITGITF